MNSASLPPRLRPLSERKSAILSVLDVGTSKVVCLIARLNPGGAVRNRCADARIAAASSASGISVRAASRAAPSSTWTRPKTRSGSPSTPPSAWPASRSKASSSTPPAAGSARNCSTPRSRSAAAPWRRPTSIACSRPARRAARATAAPCCIPCRSAFRSARRAASRSKGMIGDELGADMHVVSCDAAAARNLMLAVERCHLTVDAMVATPYAAGLSTLADDEAELGAALIDMGAGTTSVSVFSGGNLTYVDGFALGGNHVTMDIARGLSIRLADAERLKTLYGACIASASDERETISVVQVGEDGEHPAHLPKSQSDFDHQAARRGNPRARARPAESGGLSRPCRPPARPHRRREPAHRHAGGGEADHLGAGSHRAARSASRGCRNRRKARPSPRRSACSSIRR